jgi:AraC-like DNA-binding protein
MIKLVRSPSPRLAGYVRYLLVLEYANEAGDLVLPLVTNGHPSIVFLSSPGAIDGTAVGLLTVLGHNRRPFALALKERFTLIACFLHPYCLPALFGVGASEFTDRPVGLELLRPGLARGFGQRLLDASSLEQRLASMEELVLRLALPDASPAETARYATQAIRAGNGRCSLVSLQKELGLSERGLQRLFEATVGLAPRMYGRICQFDAAFRQLEGQRYTRLSDIAYQQGYADQSHFIRAFREFAGFTPLEYLRKAAPYRE